MYGRANFFNYSSSVRISTTSYGQPSGLDNGRPTVESTNYSRLSVNNSQYPNTTSFVDANKTPTRQAYGGFNEEQADSSSISAFDLGVAPGGLSRMDSSINDQSIFGKEANASEYSTNTTVIRDN